ncbi:hypothetical protein GGR53DRAFT_470289 [Hypoxylon sp. FL1150]|nr:hypothetical protein GGR53DRAFT_470289 [Hypoxylon sp. FL1150]
MAAIRRWDAPFPFSDTVPHQPGYDYAVVNQARGKRLAKMLSKLCKLGSQKAVSSLTLVSESILYEGLNAFNLQGRMSVRGCWGFVNPYPLKVPDAQADPVNWGNWEADARINGYKNTALLDDLRLPWISVTVNPYRGDADPRYRWIIWMHRHSGNGNNFGSKPTANTTYSCTVYDRENRTATWYDCWHIGTAQRIIDITAFWRNIPHGWPAEVDNALRNLTTQIIASEEIERHAHLEMSPCYSQFTMMSVILWHIRQVDMETGTPAAPAPVYPPTNGDMVSGMLPRALPRLIVTLLLTIRANPVALNRYAGFGQAARQAITDDFWVTNTRNMSEEVRMILENVLLGNAERGIIRQVAV